MMTKAKKQSASQKREKPGSSGEGDYYHVELPTSGDFTTYRTQDVGEAGHIQRVGGKRSSGSWTTVKWLISKDDAHVQNGRLVADTKDAKDVLDKLGVPPMHLTGDRFQVEGRKRNSSSRKSQSTR